MKPFKRDTTYTEIESLLLGAGNHDGAPTLHTRDGRTIVGTMKDGVVCFWCRPDDVIGATVRLTGVVGDCTVKIKWATP